MGDLLRERPIICQECNCVIGINVDGGRPIIESHHRHAPDCQKVKRVMDELTFQNEISRRHFDNEP